MQRTAGAPNAATAATTLHCSEHMHRSLTAVAAKVAVPVGKRHLGGAAAALPGGVQLAWCMRGGGSGSHARGGGSSRGSQQQEREQQQQWCGEQDSNRSRCSSARCSERSSRHMHAHATTTCAHAHAARTVICQQVGKRVCSILWALPAHRHAQHAHAPLAPRLRSFARMPMHAGRPAAGHVRSVKQLRMDAASRHGRMRL